MVERLFIAPIFNRQMDSPEIPANEGGKAISMRNEGEIIIK
jgi:hypothetical protein